MTGTRSSARGAPAGGTAGSPWDTATPVPAVGQPAGEVTLVEGQTFCISDRSGDIDPGLAQGLFVLDTRALSRFELRLDGHHLEPLAASATEPYAAVFATRGVPSDGVADAELVVFRHRHVGQGMRERVTVRNFGLAATTVSLELRADVDFADLFEVKECRVRGRAGEAGVDDGGLVFTSGEQPDAKRTRVTFSVPAQLEPGRARWVRELQPGEAWELCLEVALEVGGTGLTPLFRCDQADERTAPARRLASWRARLPAVDTDDTALDEALRRAGDDLGALRIFDPDHPELPILAAGAPWFMTVFGRDSLLTAWMTLVADPSLARGVLLTLARFQGERVDDETEEEPGKILHEMRFGASTGPSLGRAQMYYGSIDATPLFVMLLGELDRFGLDPDLVPRLLPNADRALEWVERYGDRDGDGYVEYQRRNPAGLVNQGWKDSWDAVRFADGTLARPPIALCEVQGYVYAALLARAQFARAAGDEAGHRRHLERALELRRRFNEDFWLDDQGTYALGLDADKRPIDAVTSNVGHCLWTGIVDEERAPLVARRLLAPDMFSGWGVRTLAATMAAFNPASYHNGSVWPHDNALCAAGLARYGLIEEAHRIIGAQLAVSAASGGRLPELFAGFSRDELPVPGAYPASCSPQAWASASPLLWLRTLLRLDPAVPRGEVRVAPVLPSWMHRLSVRGIQLGDSRLDVEVEGAEVVVRTSGGRLRVLDSPWPGFGAPGGEHGPGPGPQGEDRTA